ncbi:MAG: hypothetical protein NT154_14720, partial [Verrucomicrobia bacterium]|nr:hypothetical protein [Verrucomicrobiota bacterium]
LRPPMRVIYIWLMALLISGCANNPPPPAPKQPFYYYVSGEVQKPGPVRPVSLATAYWAISAAGGFTASADKTSVQIIHTDGRTETVNIKKVIEGKAHDVVIYGGDEVRVKRKSLLW